MIDWTRVTELKSEIGEDAFDEVVVMFLEEVSETADNLRRAFLPDRLEEDLHFLKGCAMNLGFSGLAALCVAGEIAARRGAASEADVADILDCFERSKTTFQAGLAAGRAA